MKQEQFMPLYPQPRLVKWLGGEKSWSANVTYDIQERAVPAVEQVRLNTRVEQALAGSSQHGASTDLPIHIGISLREGLHPEGYVLHWDDEGLRIEYSQPAGLHYAVVTIEQLLIRHGLTWSCCRIEDEPDFPVRGLMLDIGRSKIPKLSELFQLIDQMSMVKLNHLQLYMEGYCFEYEQHKMAFPESTPMTAEEFRRLDAYAASRFIDLVPNQNCLGHMGDWLSKPAYRELAEHPDGMPIDAPYPLTFPPTTLNPVDQRSLDLIRGMFDELLPAFTSDWVNINMDEPFGLGSGKSKERCDAIGLGPLYMEYAEGVMDIVRSHGKKVMMWGDVLTRHPEVVGRIPDDVTILDWNYDSSISFAEHCSMLQKNGISYYVCPGTSSWSSLSGRTDNMLNNIADAAVQGRKYGAGGLIVTDWGDNGHWQVPAISYPGYAYAAGLSWYTEGNLHLEDELKNYLTEYVFKDASGEIGHFLMELGRYYHLENSSLDNGTYLSALLTRRLKSRERLEKELSLFLRIFAELNGTTVSSFQLDFQYQDILEWLENRKEQLEKLDLQVPDADVLTDELRNTLRLIEQAVGIHRYMCRIDMTDAKDELNCIIDLESQLKLVIEEFNRLWRIRHREGGLATSTQAMYRLLDQYEGIRPLKNRF
ncbi:family 20 glycosylhydrolase [Paenibacillus sp. ISL-20]|uniref:beta-N-acetylhexosaminidase n=1 Tax=Paenibacillus sp. ISL-20 TaxID=2819163 RepID=UPI001BEA4777|nr:family 20 glycosylhydrolase [Paenibacillus sp. ISL-20]MBT2761368.1 family 20 glycosylhydrolase [Paenibacillus sp. ISL-20]